MSKESTADLPDLDACAAEPIHIPGLVQPHGALFATSRLSSEVTHWSENLHAWLGFDASANIDGPLRGCLATVVARGPGASELASLQSGQYRRYALDDVPAPAGSSLDVLVHQHGELHIYELSRPGNTASLAAGDIATRLAAIEHALSGARNIYRFARNLADQLKNLTAMDRVMVYEFHPDWSGEVIAEERALHLPAYVGLRYPASDIPAQARELYRLNTVRHIRSIAAEPARLMGAAADAVNMDMSFCALRSVSPVHLEYLGNMGVASTLTMSLVVDGKLWGLVACHHSRAYDVDAVLFDTLRRVTAIASEALAQLRLQQRDDEQAYAAEVLPRIKQSHAAGQSMLQLLLLSELGLPGMPGVTGGAVCCGDMCATSGVTPSPRFLKELAAWVADTNADGIWFTEQLSHDYPAGADMDSACGVAARVLSRSPLIVVMALQREIVHQVHWGGDPNKAVAFDESTKRLSPRKSFALWRETVRGRSNPWHPRLRAIMRRLDELLPPDEDLRKAFVDACHNDFERWARGDLFESEFATAFTDAVAESSAMTFLIDGNGAIRMCKLTPDIRVAFDLSEQHLTGQPAAELSRVFELPDLLTTVSVGIPFDTVTSSLRRGQRDIRILRRTLIEVQASGPSQKWSLFLVHDLTEFSRAVAANHEASSAFERLFDALSLSEAQFQMLAEALPQISGRVERADDKIREHHLRPEVEKLSGFSPEEFLHAGGMLSMVHPEDREQVVGSLLRAAEIQRPWTHEFRVVTAEDTERWIMGKAAPRPRSHGGVLWEGFLIDIHERKAAEAELVFLSQSDRLTGLANRETFLRRLTQALSRAARQSSSVGALVVDLDNLKLINDALGHDVGDQALIATASRLRETVRGVDTVSRLAGDQFGLIVEGLASEGHLAMVAERVRLSLRQQFSADGRELLLTASAGLAMAGGEIAAPAQTAADLLRHADLALYKAKEEGRDCTRFYDRRMNERARARLKIDQALRQSISGRELALAYQPKVNLRTRRMVGAEALLRWQRGEAEQLGPAQFIPMAEESGLIHPITDFVIARACQDLQTMATRPFGMLPVSVNVSPLSFARGDVSETILSALGRYEIAAQRFEIEVTEQAALVASGGPTPSFTRLHRAGLPIALDDFGTGYSSLQQLKALPVSCLKIDRSFVAGIIDSPADRSIVRATISLAHDFGLSVLAEGVETRCQESALLDMGCELAQGFLYGEAVSTDALQAFVDVEI